MSAPPALPASYAQLLSNLAKIAAALRPKDIATVKQLENLDHPLAAKLGIRHCAAWVSRASARHIQPERGA